MTSVRAGRMRMDPEVQPLTSDPGVREPDPLVAARVVPGVENVDDSPAVQAAEIGPWSAPTPDFDRFCAAERAAVVGLAYVLCGDWGAAEDLAQDAFFAAYRQWSRLASYDH